MRASVRIAFVARDGHARKPYGQLQMKAQAMRAPADTIVAFGVYLLVAGAGLMLVPQTLLGLIGVPAGDGLWVRFAGMLSAVLGVYYLLAARAGLVSFFAWTVWGRYAAAAFMLAVVLAGLAPANLLLLAAVDTATASWTWLSLRRRAIELNPGRG